MNPQAIGTGATPTPHGLTAPHPQLSSTPEIHTTETTYLLVGTFLVVMLAVVLLVITVCAGIHRWADNRRIKRARTAATNTQPPTGNDVARPRSAESGSTASRVRAHARSTDRGGAGAVS